MVLDRHRDSVSHTNFRDIVRHISAGDCLVFNRSRVWPARLIGKKETGGKADFLILRQENGAACGARRGPIWLALCPDVKASDRVTFPGRLKCQVLSRNREGEWICMFSKANLPLHMERYGLPPVPRYILAARKSRSQHPRPSGDVKSYQTVYADTPGSIAAPTAGLHFTRSLLKDAAAKGIKTAFVTTHIGWGTFKPIVSPNTKNHRMLPEWYEIGKRAASLISKTRREGGRVIAVGTSVTRALETAAQKDSSPENWHGRGWTSLFIYPGHSFKAIDALLTNFHLPQSTPLILAAAFSGMERLKTAYQDAVEKGYRFYSYGDAMLIL